MLWAKLVYLKPGEKPPSDEAAVILDCTEAGKRRPRYGKAHTVHRLDDLNQVIPLIRTLSLNGVEKVYLAGFEDEADYPPPPIPDMPARYGTA
jgi:hypothetical protein